MGRGLGKTDAGIPDDPLRGYPSRQGQICGCHQFLTHLGHHISINGETIHRKAVPTAMHQHVGATNRRCHGQDVWISSTATDVIEPLGTSCQGRCRYRCPIGVHRQHRLRMQLEDRPHHRHHPLKLSFRADPDRAGPAALTAQIEQVRPLGQQAARLGQGGCGAIKAAAIAERIWRQIKYAHHQRAPGRQGI